MSELVVDARILVYRVTVGLIDSEETGGLEGRLLGASALVAPSCEFMRSYRMLKTLGAEGYLTPSDVVRLSMLVCESGVELRPLWPWDIPRISALNCHPPDAWYQHRRESGCSVPYEKRRAADARSRMSDRGLLTDLPKAATAGCVLRRDRKTWGLSREQHCRVTGVFN